ncbi:alpha-L-arabinofuranosidase C-terminal domain-containing protein [Chitinophaga polysaccharea]|uniref:alpha-L-arabinofuranosidase C-terminal domain-containing protein n=1 Tax=Chitinophaga polysaccharea TaxID=1293035 RepID=UPI001FFC49A7|nr:alpha-L-arabinofuranosidase C-terminal domain-containing protein [Chitinophaga polysaccharea]
MKNTNKWYAARKPLPGMVACLATALCSLSANITYAQQQTAGQPVNGIPAKTISPNLFGIFFEDISYAADGGLYAELIQNRSFEYTPADRRNWHSLTAWEYLTKGYGYGSLSVETKAPVHPNNPHYVVLNIDDAGQEGVGLVNEGFDGIVLRAGEQYDFSVFTRLLSAQPIPVTVQLRSKKGEIYAETTFTAAAKSWKKYSLALTPGKSDDSARLAIVAKTKGILAIDMVSLFPHNTFHGRTNGLRSDLAQAVAELQPKFMRFPGGCLVHGDGLNNMYRWKNTIGPVEERKEQRNIWSYHQSTGLGYFEYFQFCEDIGAKPLPVVPAAVSCQNSGGTWVIGGTGQKALPLADMPAYIQEVLDLVEYANGPATSKWGAKRAAAGHPAPFHLEYLAIGNEDKQTPEFRERFKMIYEAVKKKYPNITLIGTSGPGFDGEDFQEGWAFANKYGWQMMDEHYYENPEWFLAHTHRYDQYNRNGSKVYIGEYASKGNTLFNAMSEALYMTGLERNGDVVSMASYAPLLARTAHTSWNPNLIYFTGNSVSLTPNYYVQQLFSRNNGDMYYDNVVSFSPADSRTAGASCVKDTKTGDVIIKLVNAGDAPVTATASLPPLGARSGMAVITILSGESKTSTQPVIKTADFKPGETLNYTLPPYSLSVIRAKTKD